MSIQDIILICFIVSGVLLLGSFLAIVFVAFVRGRGESIFPDREKSVIVHEEFLASGKFTNGGLGASNCLRVTFTDKELWVKPHFPFTAFSNLADLEHRIPYESISSCEFDGTELIVNYRKEGEIDKGIRLILRTSNEERRQLLDLMNNGET